MSRAVEPPMQDGAIEDVARLGVRGATQRQCSTAGGDSPEVAPTTSEALSVDEEGASGRAARPASAPVVVPGRVTIYESVDALKLFASWLWHNADLPLTGSVTVWHHYSRPRIHVWPLLTGFHPDDEVEDAVKAWADRLGADVTYSPPRDDADSRNGYFRAEATIGGTGDDRPVDIEISAVVAHAEVQS